MGCGVKKNGRYWPITPYKGSWAWEQEQRKKAQEEERRKWSERYDTPFRKELNEDEDAVLRSDDTTQN